MSIRSLALLALLALPARPGALIAPMMTGTAGLRPASADEAWDVLEEALAPAASSYQGRLSVSERGGTRQLAVRYAPPDLIRRESLDRLGTAERLLVSDGMTEWVWDRRTATAWRGPASARERALADPEEELALLRDNYEVRLAADETVAGRPCRVLEVSPRRGGPPVQRLWVDAEEGLILRRAAYEDGAETLRVGFETVAFDAPQRPEDFRFRPPAGSRVVERGPAPDPLELEEAAQATDMTPRPPAWVPPGYVFESVSLLPYKGATILHYRWSDGVDALSMFQSPARTRIAPPKGTRPKPETVRSAPAELSLLADGKALSWSAGERFLIIGRLPLESLRRMAESVP